MTIPTIACVMTHNRQDMVRQLVFRLDVQLHHEDDGPVIILDNASDPPLKEIMFSRFMSVDDYQLVHIKKQPPNLAYNMNQGFDLAAMWAAQHGHTEWNVAMLCDDIDLPQGWIHAVAGTMRDHNAVAASTHTIHPLGTPLLKTQPDSDIMNRMQGSAFIMAGERGIRADENLQWWWQDTDLDFQARLAGGMVIAPGPVAINKRPNEYTYSVPGLGDRAGVDRKNFQIKWGFFPW